MLYTQTGTPYYCSPEVWKDKPYDSKSDIWSLGCVLYEMAALQLPFRAENYQGLYKKVIAGAYPEIPKTYSSDLAKIIKTLLQQSPSSRPSCDQILHMPEINQRIYKDVIAADNLSQNPNFFLSTIRIPNNLKLLANRLPKPNYHNHLKIQRR
jgi:NIMA (never in mitosis gene a)-related kinase